MRRILTIFSILLILFLSSCAEKNLPLSKTEDSEKENPVEVEKESPVSETETAVGSEEIPVSSTTVTTTTKAPTTTTKAPTTTTQAPVVTTKPEVAEPPLNLVFPKILSDRDVLIYKNSAHSKLENIGYLGVSRRMDFSREFIAAFNASGFNEKYIVPNGYEMKMAYAGEENPKYPERSSGLRFVYYIKFDYTEGQKESIKTEIDRWIDENEEKFYNILKNINSSFPKPEHKLAFLTVWFLVDGGSETLVKRDFWDDSYVSGIVEPYA